MKTKNLMILISILGLIASGCAQKADSQSTAVATVPPAAQTPTVPDVPTPGTPTPSTANTIPFQVVSNDMLNAYRTTSKYPPAPSVNNPKNFRISIQLKNAGDLRYAGTIKLMYEDTDPVTMQQRTYTGVFSAPEGKNEPFNSYGYNMDVGAYKSHFNYWYYQDGKLVFTGIFQDIYGAVVLVIDHALNQGDGQGNASVAGSLWFKNFSYTIPMSEAEVAAKFYYRNCWFQYISPFSCQPQSIIKKNSFDPSADGYRKLGTFSGLVKSLAFN